MKRYALLLLFLLILPISITQAQGEVTAVESIIIDFWPDYDQASVLVLLDGVLPIETTLPVTLSIPYPENTTINAVAYRDGTDGMMNADYTIEGDKLILTTPTRIFRVEYYLPYTIQGDQRDFSFTWLSDFSVTQFEAKVQQPIASENLVTEPQAIDLITGQDGFAYHVLTSQTLAANQPFALTVNYANTSGQLSVAALPDNSGATTDGEVTIDLQPAVPAPTTTPTREYDWPLIAGIGGGVLVIAALALLYFGNQPKSRVHKPRPIRQSKKGAARFCHNCGDSVGAGDRFCRHCGTPVKGNT